MVATILVTASMAFAAAIVYMYVGWVVRRRTTSDRNRPANLSFALWWFVLGLSTGAGALMTASTYFGMRDLLVHTTFTLFNLFLICVALAGLLYYLVFLVSGKNFMIPIALAYAGLYFLLVYYILSGTPQAVEVTPWNTRLFYATPQSDAFRAVVALLVLGPQIASAVGFLSLYFATETREQRFRVITVGLSILIWFTSSLFVAATASGENWAWQVTSRALGLAAALAILLAYRPPLFFRRQWTLADAADSVRAATAAEPMRRVVPTGSPLNARNTRAGTALSRASPDPLL